MTLTRFLIISSFLWFNPMFAQTSQVSLFQADILSQFPNVRDFTSDHNSGEILFTVQDYAGGHSTIIELSKTNDTWNPPKVVAFSGRYHDLEPFFSKDGLSVYFASNRPLDQNTNTTKDFDIWVVKRASLGDDWGSPINLGPPINTDKDEFYPVITDSGNLYFTLNKNPQGSKDDIYVSNFEQGQYVDPIPIPGGVNTLGYEFNAFISPDESIIIFSGYNREDGFGNGDLYLSKRNKNGTWTEAINLGRPINSEKLDYCPFIDFERKTLYFTSLRQLQKSNDLKKRSIVDLLELYNLKDGLSKLYEVDISELLKSTN